MRSTVRLVLVLLIAGIGSYFASQTASAAGGAEVPDSCSVALQPNGVARILIEPRHSGEPHKIYRQGRQIETESWVDSRYGIHEDTRVPNKDVVHYSVFTGAGTPRVYCGAISPVVKTCSVRVAAGNPVVGWSHKSADHIWRNGKLINSPDGGAASNVGLTFDYRYVDEAAGAIGQLGHYSIEWADGSRTYCGNVTVAGRGLSCNLAPYIRAGVFIRIQADGFANAAAPGRPVAFRNGHEIPWITEYEHTNGLLDAFYRTNEINHYSIAWQNDQGVRTPKVYCGSMIGRIG